MDFIPVTTGERLEKPYPREHTTIRLEAYPLTVGTDEASSNKYISGVYNFFYDVPSDTVPSGTFFVSPAISAPPRKIRVSLLWAESLFTGAATNTSATGLLLGAEDSLRYVFADGYLVSMKDEVQNGVLTLSMELKFPAFDRNKNPCMVVQSTSRTGNNISALPTYTTSTKF